MYDRRPVSDRRAAARLASQADDPRAPAHVPGCVAGADHDPDLEAPGPPQQAPAFAGEPQPDRRRAAAAIVKSALPSERMRRLPPAFTLRAVRGRRDPRQLGDSTVRASDATPGASTVPAPGRISDAGYSAAPPS